MQSISQIVSVDSIQKTTQLDKRSTIAMGNIARQRDRLKELIQEANIIMSNLHKESDGYRMEADTLRVAFNNLESAYHKVEKQLKFADLKQKVDKEGFELRLKKIRRRRFGVGFFGGATYRDNSVEPTFGVGVTWSLFRF